MNLTKVEQPQIIQGGMGIAVSNWKLARQVSLAGQLGVVSGTAIDNVLARRLQNGDLDGNMRRAIAAYPNQISAKRILDRYFIEYGKSDNAPYLQVPKLSVTQHTLTQELLVISNFVEVWLAKEGHSGQVGINFLEKIQMANAAGIFGAMIAGVDYILIGAGIPREIPQFIRAIASGERAHLTVEVKNSERPHAVEVIPTAHIDENLFPLRRPKFLAIISSEVLASYLMRDENSKPDGFIVEGSSAGGHNAPPRGKLAFDAENEPIYGDRDRANLAKMRAIGLPFWLAGGFGNPVGLQSALSEGAAGIQVGTLFAVCSDSGYMEELRSELLNKIVSNSFEIHTDMKASPTTFPIKIVNILNSASEKDVFDDRLRLCDLGYLRIPVRSAGGSIAYRCPGEPTDVFIKKGGTAEEARESKCLCNGLMANIGLAQHRLSGYVEPRLVTLGSDTQGISAMISKHGMSWSAAKVIDYLLSSH